LAAALVADSVGVAMHLSLHRLAYVVAFVLVLISTACSGLATVASTVTGLPAAGQPAGGQFRLWQDASIFRCVRSLLASVPSGQSLLVEMYEFDRPDLEQMLLAARARGADVRVIVDRTVDVSARTAARLASAGLPVRTYPVDDSRHQIDHVKLLIAGGQALVGGMNWGLHSDHNHDYAIQTGQPSALVRLRAIFEQDWSLAGGSPRPLGEALGAPVAETTPGQEVRSALLSAIQQARSSALVEMYTLTDRQVFAALSQAHRRGLDVRVILDPNQTVNASAYRVLRKAGVETRLYPVPKGAKLHAKAGLFDGRELLLGSANWTLSGLSVNHELDLVTVDPAAAAAFGRRFMSDWQVSS
jgi:cardiolipin synthase